MTNTKKEYGITLAIWLLLLADFGLIFFLAPEEANQGLVQKIFYFHVSSAFAMYFGFLLAGLFAVLYLAQRKPAYDALSHAGATVGLVFCSMVLLSGPIWARPVWGAWWTWDPRLTTTLMIWLIFMATIFLRRFFAGDRKGPLFASILTLFGVVDIPLIFLSVKLWRGVHPSVLGEKDNMPWEMKFTLIVTNIVVLILFAFLYWLQYRVYRLEENLDHSVS